MICVCRRAGFLTPAPLFKCLQKYFVYFPAKHQKNLRYCPKIEAMRQKILLLFLCLPLFCNAQTAQNDPEYKRLVESAFGHLKNGDCGTCLSVYEQAFVLSKHSVLSHLRAAVCAERCNDVEKSADLTRAAVLIGWDVCLQLIDNPREYPELNDNPPIQNRVRRLARQQGQSTGVNFALMEELEKIRYLDQKYRLEMDSIQAAHKRESPEYKSFIKSWVLQDSLNMVRIDEIITQYGFPGKSMVGQRGSSTVWLVIQHAPLEKQEQYFPMLTQAMEKGELNKSDWAYLLDRINMRKGIPQVYGSQVNRDPQTGNWRFHPIEDEANVNARRASVGLGPLEEYAKVMGLDWSPPEKKN
jgi:hypothetical protein